MLEGECVEAKETQCTGCGETLKPQVCSSNAGYYVGFWCRNCGPYSRETGYFKHKEAAEMMLLSDLWMGDRR